MRIKLQVGQAVYHRNLQLSGVVVEPVGLGVDEGYSVLVDFEDGENREVSAHLLDTLIFVFGSNELGIHGGGAAKVAREKHGAILQQGFGPQGNSFGVPTCHVPVGRDGWEIPFERVKFYVACFLYYADLHPEFKFQVTQVGCGFAGWTKEDIAPLFQAASDNCFFDTDWKPFIGVTRKYWGHV